jgi:hypothetical protein
MDAERVAAALSAVVNDTVTVKHIGRRGVAHTAGLSTMRLAGRTVTVAWLPTGWPRQVRDVLARAAVPDLVAAPELSAGARRVASEAGMGWFDETGAAQILLGPIVVVRDGTPARRLDTNLGWRPGTLAVCEALLMGCEATVEALRNRTDLAASTVADALKFLQGQQLVTASASRGRNAGRAITDTSQLVEAYAAAAQRLRTPVSLRVGVLWRDPVADAAAAGQFWHEAGLAWSATSALSADVMAPFLTEVSPMEIYVGRRHLSGLRQAAAAANLAEMAGGRLVLRPFPTPAEAALSTELRPGFWSVPWPRVYADLRATGVRGEDAAEYLRDELGDG